MIEGAADDIVEDGVTEKFEPFVRAVLGCGCVAGVCQGFDEEGGVGESVVEEVLELVDVGGWWSL